MIDLRFSSASRAFLLSLLVALAAAAGCNAILGNERGALAETEPGAEGGATSGAPSSSSSGAFSSTSSGGSSSGGASSSSGQASSSGAPSSSSGSTGCACNAGCVGATTLCNTEAVFGAGMAVAALAANDSAVYTSGMGPSQRCNIATASCTPRPALTGPLATPTSATLPDETVYFLGGDRVVYTAPAGQDPSPVLPIVPAGGAQAVVVGSGLDFAYAFFRGDGDGTSSVRFIRGGQWNGDYALPAAFVPANASFASNAQGVFAGTTGGAQRIHYVRNDGLVGSTLLLDPSGADAVYFTGLAASEDRLFLASGTPGARVFSLALSQGKPVDGTLTSVLGPGETVARVYADGAVLFWTEGLGASTISQSYRCLAADCEATTESLGAQIVGFSHNSTYVYYAVGTGGVRRVQRTP